MLDNNLILDVIIRISIYLAIAICIKLEHSYCAHCWLPSTEPNAIRVSKVHSIKLISFFLPRDSVKFILFFFPFHLILLMETKWLSVTQDVTRGRNFWYLFPCLKNCNQQSFSKKSIKAFLELSSVSFSWSFLAQKVLSELLVIFIKF